MELRSLIISWMCICINKNEITFEEKALSYGRKLLYEEAFCGLYCGLFCVKIEYKKKQGDGKYYEDY